MFKSLKEMVSPSGKTQSDNEEDSTLKQLVEAQSQQLTQMAAQLQSTSAQLTHLTSLVEKFYEDSSSNKRAKVVEESSKVSSSNAKPKEAPPPPTSARVEATKEAVAPPKAATPATPTTPAPVEVAKPSTNVPTTTTMNNVPWIDLIGSDNHCNSALDYWTLYQTRFLPLEVAYGTEWRKDRPNEAGVIGNTRSCWWSQRSIIWKYIETIRDREIATGNNPLLAEASALDQAQAVYATVQPRGRLWKRPITAVLKAFRETNVVNRGKGRKRARMTK